MIHSSLGELGDDWQGESWTRPLLDQLVASAGGDDSAVHAVAQGWMRIGGTGTPSDAVFVLCTGRLGFASSQVSLSDHWVALPDIAALDLLEGLPYPGSAIEVRLSGDRAMLVGWPDWFSDRVVDALRAELATTDSDPAASAGRPSPSNFPEVAETVMPVVVAADVEMSALVALGPSGFTEPDVETEPEPEPEGEDLVARSVAMDEFFETPEPGSGDDGAAPADTWPSPFAGVGYHGGVDVSSRRRKNLTLILSADGVSAVASGFGKWSLQLSRDDIRGVAVQGPDELMFTYGVRIGSESSAVVVALADDVAIFEVPDRSPVTLRHELSAVSF